MSSMTGIAALRAQQQAFAAALRADAAAELPAGLLAAAPGGGPPRFGVYRHAYAARLLAALRDNFEVLARALGDEAFDALGRAYLAAHPSERPSIRWFGHRLPGFMDERLAADDDLLPHPAFADLARMEQALRDAFDAADAPVIGRDALAAVPAAQWPALRLSLHPAVRLLPLQWAVEPAWRALRSATDAGAGDDDPALPAPEPLAHTLLVWRRGLDTQWRSLVDDEAALLCSVAVGEPFAVLCEQAAAALQDGDAAPIRVVAALQQWLADGLLSGVSAS